MLSQTLCDRLAEATTELMHLQVRRTYWGYASNEDLPIEDLLVGKYQGIRPAIGYPSLPDTSVNFLLDSLLHMARIGISLTETGMMRPHASVSGLIAHPMARYFELGPIGEDQLRDYARRRGLPEKTVRRFLQRALDRRSGGQTTLSSILPHTRIRSLVRMSVWAETVIGTGNFPQVVWLPDVHYAIEHDCTYIHSDHSGHCIA